MNDRSTPNQATHDSLVRSLAKHYSSLGYIGVRADVQGFSETPAGIYWTTDPNKKFVPDITCFKNDAANTLIVAEAETCDSLRTIHTQEQFKLFAAHAKSKNGEFHIITPENCKEDAQAVARELDIIVHKFWWV